jgi:hypothetical protein
MQYDKPRPQQNHIKQAHQPKEQRHIHPPLIPNPLLHNHRVDPIEHGREKRHCIANRHLANTLVREGTTVLIGLPGEVHHGYEDDAREGGEHAEQFADGEALDAPEGAD